MNTHIHESSTTRIPTIPIIIVYVCISMILYVCTRADIHRQILHIQINTDIHIYIYTCSCTYIHTLCLRNIWSNRQILVHIQMHVYLRMCIYIYIDCLYMYICCICFHDTDDVVGRVLGSGIWAILGSQAPSHLTSATSHTFKLCE